MAENEHRDSSTSISESASLRLRGLSSSSRSGLVASGQEGQGDASDRSTNIDATPPPLGVKLTCYRLANMMIIFVFGMVKGILSYQGKSTAPMILDWVGGALLAVVLYWFGLYEQPDAKKWRWVAWVHEVDLAPAIGYSILRAIGIYMSALLYYENSWFAWLGFLIWRGSMISMNLLYIMNGIAPHLSPAAAAAVLIGLRFALATPISLINAYIRYCLRRAEHWQRAKDFADKYGLHAPLEEGHIGWFGMVGVTVGALSLILISWLPTTMLFFQLM